MPETVITAKPADSPRKQLDVGRALKLRLQGYSYREIGEMLGGYADSTVCDALQGITKLLKQPELLRAYRENKAELLESVEMKLITSLPDDLDVKKGRRALSGYQKVGMLGIVFDKLRLLRNESTENIHNLTQIIQAATARPRSTSGEAITVIPEGDAQKEGK